MTDITELAQELRERSDKFRAERDAVLADMAKEHSHAAEAASVVGVYRIEDADLDSRAAEALARISERNAARQKASRDCYEIEGCPHWVDACTRYQRAEAKLAEIEDRRDHTEGGLQLLLAAAKAGDPMQEIIFRIEEELRQLRAPVSASTEAGNG